VKKQEKRNPNKTPPRHLAGQSLDEKLSEIRIAGYLSLLLVLTLLIELPFDWWYWYRQVIGDPLIKTIYVAMIVVGVGYFNYRLRKKAKSIAQGSVGEKIAAQDIDNLKQLGCSIYHDVVVKDKKYVFNIDHVVVGNKGIFAIETKNYSKPMTGKPIARFDGKKVALSGGILDFKAVNEAKCHARWLEELLTATLKTKYIVFPIVVYPEWIVEGYTENVLVLNPKRLYNFVEKLPVIISKTQLEEITLNLGKIPCLRL
jgi:hypothetical protein